MRDDAGVGSRGLRRSLASLRSRGLNDPPTRAGVLLAYVIMLAVLVAGILGSGVMVNFSAWAASGCLPSGHPFGSSGSVTAGIGVLGSVLVAYCFGCAAYLWSIGAASFHSRVWLVIAVSMVGVVVWALTTINTQPCS